VFDHVGCELLTQDGYLRKGLSKLHSGQHEYHFLDAVQAMNLTLQKGDDTDSAFSIWDGSRFVFTQVLLLE
jgi:hypothetical protein